MSILKSAAKGAASGGVLGGPTGAVIGAGIGFAGDLVSGILGVNSQKSANKTNLQIARETNLSNELINQRNIALQRELLKSQQDYNSYSNLRKMLEEAGFNPDALFHGVSPVSSSAPSAPSPVPMQAAQVKPIDYSSFGDMSHRAIELMTKQQDYERGEIAKKREDTQLGVELATFFAKIQKLRAESDSALTERDINNLKYEYQRIVNSYADKRQDAEVRNLFSQEFANYARGGLDTIVANIQSQYGGQLAQWQINVLKKTVSHMDAQIELYHEQGLTEEEMRNKLRSDEFNNYTLGKLHLSEKERLDLENQLFRDTFKFRKGMLALDFLSGRETLENQRQQNSLLRVFGAPTAQAKLDMLNQITSQIYENAQLTKVKRHLAEKELDYADVKNSVSILKDLVSTYKGLPEGADPKEAADDFRFEFIKSAQNKGYSRSEAKALFDYTIAPALLE